MPIRICTNYEVVGQSFTLGANRRKAIDQGAEKAANFLRGRGWQVELTNGIHPHELARVHNWFALPHDELSPAIAADIAEAAKLYCATLKTWEDLTS